MASDTPQRSDVDLHCLIWIFQAVKIQLSYVALHTHVSSSANARHDDHWRGWRARPLRRDGQRHWPVARTRLTTNLQRPDAAIGDGWDRRSLGNIAPLVAWLASTESADLTGQVFEVGGGSVGVAEGWRHGPTEDEAARLDPAELGPTVRRLVGQAYQVPVPAGRANRQRQ